MLSRKDLLSLLLFTTAFSPSWAEINIDAQVRQGYDLTISSPAIMYQDRARICFNARGELPVTSICQIDSSTMELVRLCDIHGIYIFYERQFVFSELPSGIKTSVYLLDQAKKIAFPFSRMFVGGNKPFVYFQNGFGYGTADFGYDGVNYWYTRKYDLYNGVVDELGHLYHGIAFSETTLDKQHVLDVDHGSAEVVQLPSLRRIFYLRKPEGRLSNAGFLGNSMLCYTEPNKNTWAIYALDGKKIETFRLNLIGKDKRPYKEGIRALGIYFFEDLRYCMVEVTGGPNWLLVDTSELRDWLVEHGYLFAPRDDILVEDAVLYENANPDAKVMGKGTKGEQVTLLDKSGAVTIIGGRTAFWYKARTGSGAEGWVFGAALQSADAQDVVDSSLHTAVMVKQLSASSFLTEPTDLNIYQPVKVFDEHTNTGWLEKTTGPGIGESITIGLDEPILVDTIKVRPGYFDERYWQQNNRVKKLEVILDGVKRVTGSFKDKMEVQDIALKPPLRFTTAQFIIRDVYKTAKWDDTGLAEVEFWYKGHKYPLDITRFAEELKKKPK